MSDTRRSKFDSNRLLLWLIHGGAVLGVTVAFLLVVMTAVAQQEVVASIKQQQLALGYGAALSIRNEAQKVNGQLSALRTEAQKQANQLREDQVKFLAAQRRWQDSWDELLPFVERLTKTCGIEIPKDKSFGSRAAALNDLKQCQASAPNTQPGSQFLAASHQPASTFAQAQVQYRDAFDAFSITKDRLEGLRAQLATTALSDVEAKVDTSFSEMNVLFSNWMLVGGTLGLFPPALLQILLTFFSGLFGAILVTLVLLVYPKSNFDITATKETWARVFLGGLIALCVYIVLLGGTAVMGASSGLSAAGSNYMAFCGIGILAGMFSDRVAFWLSDRANSFFRSTPGSTAAAHSGGRGNP